MSATLVVQSSPPLVRGEPGAWDLLESSLPWPIGALNLCCSMVDDHDVVDRFLARFPL